MKKFVPFIFALTLAMSSCVLFPDESSTSSSVDPSTSISSSSISTSELTSIPTSEPTSEPTSNPTSDITSEPTSETSSTSEQTSTPTLEPTSVPTSEPTSVPTSEPTSVPTSVPSTSEPTSMTSDTSTSEEPDTSRIDYITLDKKELELTVGQRASSLIVTFYTKIPDDDYNNEVIFTSEDETIATIDQYGRVTGQKIGKTIVKCTTVEGQRHASCVVYVVSSHDAVTKKWLKVTHQSELSAGDILVMGCPEENVVATSENTGMYLHPVSSTFSASGDEITSLPSEATQFMLDGELDNWTLENEEGKYLATTHTGKVTFIYKTGNVHWYIDYDNEWNCCDMRSTSTIDGWFMYNAKNPRFTTYESSTQIDMFVITLYKLTRIYE